MEEDTPNEEFTWITQIPFEALTESFYTEIECALDGVGLEMPYYTGNYLKQILWSKSEQNQWLHDNDGYSLCFCKDTNQALPQRLATVIISVNSPQIVKFHDPLDCIELTFRCEKLATLFKLTFGNTPVKISDK